MMEGYSLSDIAAATGNGNNNNDGWGGNSAWWIIVLFLFWGRRGGYGGFGGGNGVGSDLSGVLTRGDLCMDFNFQNLLREAQNTNDAVNLGFSNLNSTICNQQYDTARMINGVESAMQGGFNSTNIAMLQGFNAIQAQAERCCCDQRAATADLKFTIANEDCRTRNLIQNTTRDMIDVNNANTRAILDKLTRQEIEAKNAQIAALNQQLFRADLAASQTAQNAYLVNTLRPCPQPAYITCSPFQASYGIGLNNGCGCGCGNAAF